MLKKYRMAAIGFTVLFQGARDDALLQYRREPAYTAAPDRIFYIDINASVDRQNTKKVHKILDSIINDLQHNPATERELNTLKRIFIVNKRNTLEENATAAWKGYLVGQIKNDETLVELDMYEDVLESITAEELRREFIKCRSEEVV